jgi:hypothetical protein
MELRNGDFSDTDRVGTVHDMRFVLMDNDTKMLFATAYDGDWDPYIDDFAARFCRRTYSSRCGKAGQGFKVQSERLDRGTRSRQTAGTSPIGSDGAGHSTAEAGR